MATPRPSPVFLAAALALVAAPLSAVPATTSAVPATTSAVPATTSAVPAPTPAVPVTASAVPTAPATATAPTPMAVPAAATAPPSIVPAAAIQEPAPTPALPQTSADGYTRYELREPGSGAFRIVYDITATTPGAVRYFNTIREGAEEEVHGVVDVATGRPLEWELVDGATARTRGHPTASLDGRYLQVTLLRPVPVGGEVRVRIDKTYVDHESYFADEAAGEIVFDRSLGVPRNAVVLPAGWELAGVNLPSQVDTEADGRIRVSFMNPTGLSLRYRVRARPLPADAAAALRRAAAGSRPPPERPAPPAAASPGYDGSYARTDRTFDERAAQTREIVYFLEQPASHSFRLYHDYAEERPGRDHYLNVVRAGSSASDPRAWLLDTGEELEVETVRGREVAERGLMEPDGVDDETEVVVIRYPEVREGTSARLRIWETYTDPARYTLAGEELVWDRSFGRAMNEVVLPQGWFLTASDIPAAVETDGDGRVRLRFWNPRPDGIQVFLRGMRRDAPVATSLFGEELLPRIHPDPRTLAAARAAVEAAPGDPEAVIGLARELRNAFRYDEAIDLYTRAAGLAPDDWRPWRFRGHRLLSTRRFAEGADDLERARELAPDDFDVAYHLGLAYYLMGRFDEAADEYLRCLALADDPGALARQDEVAAAGHRSCMTVATDGGARVAVTEWAYRALRRAGRHDEARALAATVEPDLDPGANGAYHEALLAHRGLLDPAALTLPLPPEGRFETRAYGVALDELLDGDRERALLLLRRIAADPHWPGFGRLAAEADLARMEGGR